MWHNDVFWGIEMPKEHLWMVQELCTESWRAASTEGDEGRGISTGRDRGCSVTEGHVVEQIRDANAAEICKQVWDDREAMRLSESYTGDET
jgi:hypothetical protein